MEKLINITAPQYRCPTGECPAVYKSEDGKKFVVIGETAVMHPAGLNESAVKISADLLLSSLGSADLIEAAMPIVDRLNWHEANLDYWAKASDESVGELEFPVTAAEARALRSVLTRIQGGDGNG